MIGRRPATLADGDDPALLRHPALPWPIEVRRHPQARRMLLRIDEARARLRLTLPARASIGPALEWAAGQRAWVERRMAKVEPRTALVPGATIPFGDGQLRLRHDPAAARTPRITHGELVGGGPIDSFAARIGRFLRRLACERMSALTAEMAAHAEVTVTAVSVGDAATRWGSCTASGAIRYNWRLVMAPTDVQRYLAAHEVAHRRHMDHGQQFHALEARLFGGPVGAARLALRRVGLGLRRVG